MKNTKKLGAIRSNKVSRKVSLGRQRSVHDNSARGVSPE